MYGNVINSEKSFFTNNPPSHPESIGVPHGHPILTSFLGVPLVLDRKMMGMLGVANREGGYSSRQQVDLEAITPAIVQALNRKKSELERKRIAEKLQDIQKRLLIATDSAEIGTYDYNLVSDTIDWDARIRELLGMEPEKLVTYEIFWPTCTLTTGLQRGQR